MPVSERMWGFKSPLAHTKPFETVFTHRPGQRLGSDVVSVGAVAEGEESCAEQVGQVVLLAW